MKQEFYVMRHDFNSKKVEYYNIFNNIKFDKAAEKIKKEFKKDKDFVKAKEEVRKSLMYCYWSKAEYEVIVYDLIERCDGEKIDIYEMCFPNLTLITHLVLEDLEVKKWKK